MNYGLAFVSATRFRTYSKDSSIDNCYPTSSSSSLSGYHTGNRSSHTDASSLSSSDELHLIDVPPPPPPPPPYSAQNSSTCADATVSYSTDTNSDGNKTRRRSHRPRGCRGGRKNRKKQLAKVACISSDQGVEINLYGVPTEIGATLGFNPLSPKENNIDSTGRTNSNHHSVFLGTTKPMWSHIKHPNYSSSDPFVTSARPWGQQSIPDENNSYWRQPMTSNMNHSNVANLTFSTTSSIFDPTISVHNEFTYRPMQMGTPSKLSSTGIFESKGQDILPPPPQSQSETDQDSTKLQGPNPYALSGSKLSLHVSLPSHLSHRASSTGGNSYADAATVYTTSSTEGTSASVLSLDTSAVVDEYDSDESYHHRHERIQKQRQMMADGNGSLFATSPRSFLMGRQYPNTEVAW